MNYGFEYNSSSIGKEQIFRYNNPSTTKYLFTYGRDIYSKVREFNPPIFVHRENRGIFLNCDNIWVDKIAEELNNPPISEFGHVISSNIRIANKLFTKHDDKTEHQFNIHKEIIAKRIINTSKVFTYVFIKENNTQQLMISDAVFINRYLSLQIYKDYFLKKTARDIDTYKDILVDKIHTDIVIQSNMMLYNNLINNTNIYENISGHRPEINANIYNNIAIFNPVNYLNIYSNILAEHDIYHKIHYYDKDTKVKLKNINSMFIEKDTLVVNIDNKKELSKNIYDRQLFGKLPDLSLKVYKNILGYYKPKTILPLQEGLYATRNNFKNTNIQNIKAGYKNINKTYINNKDKFFKKHNKESFKNNINVFLEKDKLIAWKESYITAKTNNKNAYIIKHLYLDKVDSYLNKNTTEAFVVQDKAYTSINNIGRVLYKDKNPLVNFNNVFAYKDRHGFSTDNNLIHFFKDRQKIKDPMFENYNMTYKEKHGFRVKDYDCSLSEIRLPFNIEFHDNTIGFIVSAAQVQKNKENSFMYKYYHKSFSNKFDFLYKDKQTSKYTPTSLFVFDDTKKVFIEDYHATLLSKNIKTSLKYHEQQYIEKNSKNGIIYDIVKAITKKNKEVTKVYDNTFLKRFYSTSLIDKGLFANKNNYLGLLSNNFLPLDKNQYNFYKDSDLWIDKTYNVSIYNPDIIGIEKEYYEVFIDNSDIFIEKAKYGFSIEDKSNVDVYKNKQEFFIEDTSLDLDKSRNGLLEQNTEAHLDKEKRDFRFDEDYIIIPKEKYELSPLVQEMQHMKKTVKDLEKNIQKTYNWAYVYENEDPISPNYNYYGLDELLLPEKDVDYSSFEDIVFNKKTMKPNTPVKIIDNKTFIAKYPIKHPTPDYEDVGIEYIDVPSDLMRELFLRFYQIWYGNIFKFGNMSMVDSLKLMLDYMYSYIVLNHTGTEYIEPALRVFRLIRWFGESSVMKNAHYKITLEYEDLKSNLQNGHCSIPNVMQGMFVNTALKVISTSSTYFNKDAYIKLYIQNKEDTQMTFSISLVSGFAEVYLNDELIDSITKSNPLKRYDIPGSTDTNIITIKRPANTNQSHCYIGNIVVKNGLYKDLNITYDPDLKAGNIPLNDVANRMVILANMYDNETEAFEQFRKGNLAVSELYKKLQDYWELHHADKIKGKRLTIKES